MSLEHDEPFDLDEVEPAPFGPSRLLDLYIRPRKFFGNPRDLDHRGAIVTAAFLMGISGAMGRIDKKIVQSELGRASASWDRIADWMLSSWFNYWLVVLVAGAFGGVFLWYLKGWWYKKRLEWAGAQEPSLPLARRVHAMQELVMAGPAVLWTWIQTFLYANYREAWQADELWSTSILVFVFWSCWTSYVGATTVFSLSRTKARVWFLILPAVLYLFAVGAIGFLYSYFGSTAG